MKGFTLLEMIITISLLVIVLLVTLPGTLSFLKTQNSDDATTTLVTTLRQAHTQAVFQKNDSSFGIKIFEHSYVFFQGNSYATRTVTEDITITIPNTITLSGLDEIVFAKRTGIPTITGTILIQSTSGDRSISINQQGIVELL